MKLALPALLVIMLLCPSAQAGYQRDFEEGSLIVPMDLAYQDHGMFQAYGLLFQLLRQGIDVYWVIDLEKDWHHAPCDTDGNECSWDCHEEGSGVKCPYPTGSPDFFVGARIVWDGEGQAQPGDLIDNHGYRGGPFVVDAADQVAALAIIDVWNDPDSWAENPWAQRTVFETVSVHEATADFSGYVRKKMVAAPTIAVFSDGNEHIATSYLRAAGIPQSNGNEFPPDRCGADNCGPGTENPDMMSVESVMGDMGTCEAPNTDHKNGSLFTADGVPAYCQIMSMHWGVNDREDVKCNGGDCPATQADCNGEVFTYHGHEVVAEVRQFLMYPVHFFAECQAVNAYENLVPNPDWPYLDDTDRKGHFLTDTGNPPDCPCEGDFECVAGYCDGGTRDCCQPKNIKEKGAGFLIADQPDSNNLKILHPEVPYNQMDGAFQTVGGSEPAYNLSTYLDTQYIKDLDVTFITSQPEAGEQDVWMTGYLDGECDITDPYRQPPEECNTGKISYLGGHSYKTDVPLSGSPDSQGTRLFLNALFEADCVTATGQPDITMGILGETMLISENLPAQSSYSSSFINYGPGVGLDSVLSLVLPADAELADFEPGGTVTGNTVSWDIGSIGGANGGAGDPPSTGSRWAEISFPDYGEYQLEARLEYRVGVTTLEATPRILTVQVLAEAPPDGGTDAGGDSTQDAGIDAGTSDSNQDGGGPGADTGTGTADDCGCSGRKPQGLSLMLGLLFLAFSIRRRGSRGQGRHLGRRYHYGV